MYIHCSSRATSDVIKCAVCSGNCSAATFSICLYNYMQSNRMQVHLTLFTPNTQLQLFNTCVQRPLCCLHTCHHAVVCVCIPANTSAMCECVNRERCTAQRLFVGRVVLLRCRTSADIVSCFLCVCAGLEINAGMYHVFSSIYALSVARFAVLPAPGMRESFKCESWCVLQSLQRCVPGIGVYFTSLHLLKSAIR